MQVHPVIDQEFLPLRAKILEIAAALDRLDRTRSDSEMETRRAKVRSALEALLNSRDDRAEQVQLIFSRPYAENWQEAFAMKD